MFSPETTNDRLVMRNEIIVKTPRAVFNYSKFSPAPKLIDQINTQRAPVLQEDFSIEQTNSLEELRDIKSSHINTNLHKTIYP